MKKLFLFSLILVLIGVMILPAVAAPKTAEAWSGTVTCNPGELYFRVYEGVPTYLLGFIPLEEGQELTLTYEGSGIAGWTLSDDATWLNENLLLGVLSSISADTRTQTITVRVNTNGLDAGTYAATITFKFTTCATTTITVPVTVDVIEPKVMGPLGIGMLNIFDTSTENYGGFVLNLLTNPDDAMDMQAIETDGCFNLMIQRGDEIPDIGLTTINGGTLTINGETKQLTTEGGIAPLSSLISMMGGSLPIPEDFDWGENYAVIFITTDGICYIGILIEDVGKLLPMVDMLGGMFSGEETESTSSPAPTGKDSKNDAPSSPVVNEPSPELVLPLKPILNLLPTLMPVMMNLLSNETVLAIIQGIAPILPPIMIVLPMDVMMELFSGLM